MGWRDARNIMLGSPWVRAQIARLPLGRAVAAYHTRRLFGLVAGFAESQLLLAALELGVFDRLAHGPCIWASVVELPPRGATALEQGLIAAGLIERRGKRVALTVDGLVVASEPGLRALIAHNRLLYADLADPVATLAGDRDGAVARFWPYAGRPGNAGAYRTLMAASQGLIAAAMLNAVRWSTFGHVVDVGGGDGAFLVSLRGRYPDLPLTLVDLPPVVADLDLARERIAVKGITADAPLPRDAGAMTLVRLLHDLDDSAAERLLKRVVDALPHGGSLVIAEPMARPGRDPQTAYFAAYFAAMGSGQLRSADEIRALLRKVGFSACSVAATTPLVTVIVARCL